MPSWLNLNSIKIPPLQNNNSITGIQHAMRKSEQLCTFKESFILDAQSEKYLKIIYNRLMDRREFLKMIGATAVLAPTSMLFAEKVNQTTQEIIEYSKTKINYLNDYAMEASSPV